MKCLSGLTGRDGPGCTKVAKIVKRKAGALNTVLRVCERVPDRFKFTAETGKPDNTTRCKATFFEKTFSIFDINYKTQIKTCKMKKHLLLFAVLLMAGIGFNSYAQSGKPKLKKETVNASAVSTPDSKVDALQRPVNDKNKPAAPNSTRGDVYGSDYSDVVIDNWTGYYIDIYVNGNYRGTVSPYDKRVTWAIPGNNTLYAKAVFNDGSYLYWGPKTTYTGYSYTWKLNP